MTRPADLARRIVENYEPGFRATLTLAPAQADDPEALRAAADALPDAARALLELLVLVAPPGEAVPERLRALIERDGRPLWAAALLLPRVGHAGADIHPLRYAGACRLNPALHDWQFPYASPSALPTPTFPPSDARWDAVVVAAALDTTPAQLTVEGALRKDVERRLFTAFGPDTARWSLALQVARLSGLVRPSEGRLRGYPEAHARLIRDPVALFTDAAHVAAAAALLRLMPRSAELPELSLWIDVPALLERLRTRCRQLVWSPAEGRYAGPADPPPFDDVGWTRMEAPLLLDVLDVLHRGGVIDASRTADGTLTAVRRAGPRPTFTPGFLLLPDGDILVHSGELETEDYGRLARLAPYVEGARMHRHRLTREGAAADVSAGHHDTLAFLERHSRTGVPPHVADSIRDWQRAAQRIVVLTGLDVIEDDEGRLRLATAGETPAPVAPATESAAARTIDYTAAPRARFVYRRGRIAIPDGWDALTVRAAVERVARYVGREGDERVYAPEIRSHADPGALLERLRAFHGGELPGEIEVLVLSGADLPPVVATPVHLVRLPATAAGPLRRDWIAGPLLKRALSDTDFVVTAEDLAPLRARVETLGLRWSVS